MDDDEKIELDKRWLEIFRHFGVKCTSHTNLKILIKISLCYLHTNAAIEREFSPGNNH